MRIGKVFLDESLSGHSYQTAGWIAGTDFWEAFAPLWQLALRDGRSIDYFKWSEGLRLEGQFKGWTEVERDHKFKQMASLFPHNDRMLQGVACHMTRQQFGDYAKKRMRRPYNESPYFIEMFVTTLWATQTYTNFDQIDFILDLDKCKHSGRVRDFFYKKIKPIHARFGDCFELSDKTELPLQGADLLAGVLRQTHEPRPLFHEAASLLNGILTRELNLDERSLKCLFEHYPGRLS
jgi:hypothetical protein